MIGAVLYGETSDGNFYSQLINEQIDVSEFKDALIFGAAYCQSLLDQQAEDKESIAVDPVTNSATALNEKPKSVIKADNQPNDDEVA